MAKRGQLIAVLFAWLLATGTQWDLVQVFGWAQMIVNYARVMPLEQAIKKTFSGEMCQVCEAVNDAKQEPAVPVNPGQKDAKIFLAVHPISHLVLPAPEIALWSPSDPSVRSFDRGAPPLPPPRA